MAKQVNPSELIFRESDQNSLDAIRAAFPGDEYSPIVVIRDANGARTILDGHNRATVAAERGHLIPAVEIYRGAYETLSESYTDMEIAYGVLDNAGEYDAANALDDQFPGSNVAGRGADVSYLLDN